MLEVALVQFRQPLRVGEIGGLAFFLKLQFLTEHLAQAALDELAGEIRDSSDVTRILRQGFF